MTFSTDQPADWSAEITVDGVSDSEPSVPVTLSSSDTPIGLLITPGSTSAVANYTLEIT